MPGFVEIPPLSEYRSTRYRIVKGRTAGRHTHKHIASAADSSAETNLELRNRRPILRTNIYNEQTFAMTITMTAPLTLGLCAHPVLIMPIFQSPSHNLTFGSRGFWFSVLKAFYFHPAYPISAAHLA